MSGFDLAAILLAIAAVFGYLNHRILRLPPTSGMLAVALVSSLLLVAADAALPSLHMQATVAPKSLEAQIAGESLFNDGVGVDG